MSAPDGAGAAGGAPAAERASHEAAWPELRFQDWRDTYATLHRWSQVVGKTPLALCPSVNHWWHVAFHVTGRGLHVGPMPYGDRTFDVDFDFLAHRLVVRTSRGQVRELPLRPRSVADFYAEYLALLDDLDIRFRMLARPVELPEATPFDEDRDHAAYDAEAVGRFFRALVSADRVVKEFRGRFLGKASPVHFFWGGFDLAATRFSGRPAPPHPGGAPNVADWVMREAYSHEVSSAGFWPGSDAVPEPLFYAYAYPEPPGFADAPVGQEGAYYHPELREFVLPYDAVRTAANPDATLLEFLHRTYEAAADLAGWDRAALERLG